MKPATPNQIRYYTSLAQERGEPLPDFSRMTIREASEGISRLRSQPVKASDTDRGDGTNLTDVPSGRYAVEVGGRVQFYKLDNLTDASGRWAGWVFAKHQQGDNFARAGAQRPGQTYRGDHDEAMRLIVADPLAAAKRYGHALGVCAVCGRALTDPDSIAAGIGPVCAKRF